MRINKITRICLFAAGVIISGYWGYMGYRTIFVDRNEIFFPVICLLLMLCSLFAAITFIRRNGHLLLLSAVSLICTDIWYMVSFGQSIYSFTAMITVIHCFTLYAVYKSVVFKEGSDKTMMKLASLLMYSSCALCVIFIFLKDELTNISLQVWSAVAVHALLAVTLRFASNETKSQQEISIESNGLAVIQKFRRYDLSALLLREMIMAVTIIILYIILGLYVDLSIRKKVVLITISIFSTCIYYFPYLKKHFTAFTLCSDGKEMYICEKRKAPIPIRSAKSIYLTIAKERIKDSKTKYSIFYTLHRIDGKLRKIPGIWITMMSSESAEYYEILSQASRIFEPSRNFIYGFQYNKKMMQVISENFDGNLFIEKDVYEVISDDISEMTFLCKSVSVFENKTDLDSL